MRAHAAGKRHPLAVAAIDLVHVQRLGLQGVEVEIEPWIPQHTLLWYKLMAEQMSGGARVQRGLVALVDGPAVCETWLQVYSWAYA